MREIEISRRNFNRSLACLLTALAATARSTTTWAQATRTSSKSARREVIKQPLPGEPPRDLVLVEVTYPPGTASPAHLHANGVMAFVVSGSVVSRVDDAPERTYHAGEAWWEPPGAVHRVSRNASATEPATLLAIYPAPRGASEADLIRPT